MCFLPTAYTGGFPKIKQGMNADIKSIRLKKENKTKTHSEELDFH